MPIFAKLINDKVNGYPLVISEDLKPITDKTARARPAQGWCQQGKILLPADQPWVEDFVAELLRFPNGVWDDRVDALAWLVRMVVKQSPPKRPNPKPQKSWKDNLQRFTNGSTQGVGGHMSA